VNLGRNLLFYGDNLDVLRNRIPSASVDLVYLDPPFNSNRSYNVPFLPYIQAKRLAAPTEQLTLG
jgi:16S rRNA G966 N2-methylase RsmD